MLLDVLGVIVGFATVMLVVSLIVTALTQFVHTMLGFRASSLRYAIQALLERALASGDEPLGSSPAPGKPRALAGKVVASARFRPTERRADPEAMAAALAPARQVRTPELDELERWIADAGIALDDAQLTELRRRFDEAMLAFSDQFERAVKVVVVILSFLAAFVLQLSTTDLAIRLSSDAMFRAAAVQVGEHIADREPSDLLLRPRSYEEVSEAALVELARLHPEDAGLIEQASGVGGNAEVVNELDTILRLEGHARRAELVEEYRGLLDAGLRSDLSEASRQLQEQYAHLAMLDLRPWRGGWEFYRSWRNWLGVLLTTALLSLGAPFWYDTLRKSVHMLRTVRGEAGREPIKGSPRKPMHEKAEHEK